MRDIGTILFPTQASAENARGALIDLAMLNSEEELIFCRVEPYSGDYIKKIKEAMFAAIVFAVDKGESFLFFDEAQDCALEFVDSMRTWRKKNGLPEYLDIEIKVTLIEVSTGLNGYYVATVTANDQTWNVAQGLKYEG